jgi:hypothetical protein
MLEKAGKPVAEIRARSHNLAELLKDLGHCRIHAEIAPGQLHAVSASRLRAKTLKHGDAEITVGAVIDTEPNTTSQYPNQVRYGDQLRHYPPEVVSQLATRVVTFARENWLGLHVQ